MGGALIQGWLGRQVLAPAGLLVLDPAPGEGARLAGVRLDPTPADIARARTVIMAVKPQAWREAAGAVAPALSSEAVVISIMAGVACADLSQAFGRPVARAMPTLAAALGAGPIALFCPPGGPRTQAEGLFARIGDLVLLPDEGMMHAATAVGGSGPAYAYALVEAMAKAAAAAGLPREAADRLASGALSAAAALLESSGRAPAQLRAEVTSPGGVTEAAMAVLMAELPSLTGRTVAAATARSEALAR
jgi:pyrroline-5-carboxylate reductase